MRRPRRLGAALDRRAREVTGAEAQRAATWLITRRHHRLSVALLDVAESRLGPQADITLLRRTIPGYVGRVPRRQVRRAARQAVGNESASVEVCDEPLSDGTSPVTVAVVRHTVRPHGLTFIRKSVHGTLPREVRLYRSGLVSEPGRWFRTPAVLGVERQGRYWHLFLEDMQAGTRPRSAADFVNCARGLAELGARSRRDVAPEQSWLAMGPGFELSPYEGGIRAAAQLLAPDQARRLLGLFERLCTTEADVVAQVCALPRTLCHGDAHAGNMIMDPVQVGRMVIIDWQMANVGPIGMDLGRLMSVPSSFARGAQLDPEACRQGYFDCLGAPASDHEGVQFACDFVVVWESLKWWATRNQPNTGWLRDADVNRICQAAEALLARVNP